MEFFKLPGEKRCNSDNGEIKGDANPPFWMDYSLQMSYHQKRIISQPYRCGVRGAGISRGKNSHSKQFASLSPLLPLSDGVSGSHRRALLQAKEEQGPRCHPTQNHPEEFCGWLENGICNVSLSPQPSYQSSRQDSAGIVGGV